MDVLGEFMLLSFSKQFQDGRHDVLIVVFLKVVQTVGLYKHTYWCAYSFYVFHTLVENQINPMAAILVFDLKNL